MATPDLLERNNVGVGSGPGDDFPNGSAIPGESADIITQNTKGVHYLATRFYAVGWAAMGVGLVAVIICSALQA